MIPLCRPLQLDEIICGQMESSVTADYLNMNALYEKMNEERENATQKDHFGLAKLLREKSQSSIEGKVITILIFSYAILKKRFGGRFTFINMMS
jgi:hypothetical protein